jgi:serine/threonine protein phosphatase PrpC
VVSALEKIKQAVKAVRGRRLRSWQTAHLSIQGDKHVRDSSPCQDHSDSRAFEDGSWAYVVVADGHGSDRHFRSDRGSEFAVATMHDVVHTFRRRARDLGEPSVAELGELWMAETDKIVRTWRKKVHVDLVKHPARVPGKTDGERGLVRYLDDFAKRNGYAQLELLFWQLRRFEEYARGLISKEAEAIGPLPHFTDSTWDQAKFGGWQAKAYGTTVLGVLAGPESLHWVQLGDGAMVQIVGGEASYLVRPPAEALGNLTPSLCDEDAQDKIRRGTFQIDSGRTPSAILLTTDGVPNSYADDDGFFSLCQDLAHHAETSADFSADLSGWLQTISREGSGDDMSVALAWLTELPRPEKQARRSEQVPRDVSDTTHQVAEPVVPSDNEQADDQALAMSNGDPSSGRHAVREPAPANPLEPERPALSTTGQEMKGSDHGAQDR